MKAIAPTGFGYHIPQAELFDGGRKWLEFVCPDSLLSVPCCFCSGVLIPAFLGSSRQKLLVSSVSWQIPLGPFNPHCLVFNIQTHQPSWPVDTCTWIKGFLGCVIHLCKLGCSLYMVWGFYIKEGILLMCVFWLVGFVVLSLVLL